MAKKQKTDFKEKSVEALRADVKDAKRALFTVRFDMEMRKDKNTKLFLSKRKEFARLMTALRNAEIVAKNKSVRQAQDKKEVANG
jgi:ribosomal protein L29